MSAMPLQLAGFDEPLASELAHSIEHIEGDHGDSVLFVARYGAEPNLPDLTSVFVDFLEPSGMQLSTDGPDGVSVRRIDFSCEIASQADLSAQLRLLLSIARAAAPDERATSIEVEVAKAAKLQTYVGHVRRTRRVAPNIVEVTIGAVDGVPALGGDECYYVMVPNPLAPHAIDDQFTMADIESMADRDKPVGAYYTCRRRQGDEIDLWILLHGHHDGVSGWAARAQPGDAVALWGPRGGYSPPTGTTHQLLVCDETGLPAVAAMLEALPAGQSATVIAETIDAAHRPEFPEEHAKHMVWLERGSTEAGTTGLAPRAVRSLDLSTEGLYAFGAGESREYSAIRRYLRRELGMEQQAVFMSGYWRR